LNYGSNALLLVHSLASRGTSGERAGERGEGWGEGKSNKTKLLSPTLSSSFVGREGEVRFRFRRRFPYFNGSGVEVRASVLLN
jgi:hypothetical protein